MNWDSRFLILRNQHSTDLDAGAEEGVEVVESAQRRRHQLVRRPRRRRRLLVEVVVERAQPATKFDRLTQYKPCGTEKMGVYQSC